MIGHLENSFLCFALHEGMHEGFIWDPWRRHLNEWRLF